MERSESPVQLRLVGGGILNLWGTPEDSIETKVERKIRVTETVNW
jgi:hypothetical protein